MLKKIALLFSIWRLLLFIPLILAQIFIPYRTGYSYTSPLYFLTDKHSLISNFLISPWLNFDGVYYLLIAAQGYTVNAGFFPLFPLSIHFITSIFGEKLAFDPIQYFVSIFLVSAYFLASLFILFKLIRLDYKDNVAIWSIVFTLIFPTSFFFAAIYSESLFLFLTVLSFYFARKKNWFLASVCGGLLTATRLVGIAIIPALIFEFILQNPSSLKLRRAGKTFFNLKSLSLLLTPLGILSYILFNLIKWGNAFYFIEAQGNFQNNRTVNGIVFFPQTIFRYIKIIFTVNPNIYEWKIALLELSAFFFAGLLLYVAWKKKVRLSYILFALICFLIPVTTGTFSSLPRYVLVMFPIFIALALIKNKTIKIVYSIISLALLFILFALFSKGYFIA